MVSSYYSNRFYAVQRLFSPEKANRNRRIYKQAANLFVQKTFLAAKRPFHGNLFCQTGFYFGVYNIFRVNHLSLSAPVRTMQGEQNIQIYDQNLHVSAWPKKVYFKQNQPDSFSAQNGRLTLSTT